MSPLNINIWKKIRIK